MKKFRFTIQIDAEHLTDEDVERLYESGCDDATIGKSLGKCQAVFRRDAASLEEAVKSAANDIQRAGLKVAKIESEEWATIQALNEELASIH